MCSTFVKKILPLLKDSYLVKEDCSEEELLTILYGKSEERLNILQWLLSQISVENKLHILNAECLENEIAHQLHELEFTDAANKLLFVKGLCPEKEQKLVYTKIFRALNFVMFTGLKPPDQTKINSDLHLQNKFNIGKGNDFKKHIRPFDLQKAWDNLEETTKLLAESKEECLVPYEAPELESDEDSGSPVTKADLDKLRSFCTSLSDSLSTSVPSASQRSVNRDSAVELSSAVADLHKTLQSIKVTKEKGQTEITKIDMSKVLEDIRELKKSSNILNLKRDKSAIISNVY